ncbi:MAG: hypothetical protein ACK5MA_02090 [Parachlamydiaceae bacterium]
MRVDEVCKNYFYTIFAPGKALDRQSEKIRALAIVSLFTLIIPLGFAISLGIAAALRGRVQPVDESSSSFELHRRSFVFDSGDLSLSISYEPIVRDNGGA